MIEEVRAFEGGYCRQLLAMVDRRSCRLVRFQAVFLALRHRREGWVLVDTGYGTQFKEATRRFPQRFYRWATPATAVGSTAELLANAGIRAEEIRHVIVTHFHADHIGGLGEFPHAQVHYRHDALETLQRLPAFHQVRAAYLSHLVPNWLAKRGNGLAPEVFRTSDDLPFGSHDVFADQSLRMVFLPGHAPGQVGVAFHGPQGPELYVADAYWRWSQIVDGIEPLGIAMSFQWDAEAYRTTVQLLREVHRQERYRLTACHDEGSCQRLNERGLGP
jgi:glyoxylase-like metal-dependent hydrolase (beta-lactamase superfamily II)